MASTLRRKQTADNDYAVGKLIERVAHSPYASSTLIFVIEDDAQNGPDHVDAHRTIAFVVGPYVKQGSVVHERYSTVNMVRTIEDVLGFGHLNLNDAYQRPMTAIFDLNQSAWTYDAIVPAPIAGELSPASSQGSTRAGIPRRSTRRILGAPNAWLRLVPGRSRAGRTFQSDPLEGPDRRSALPCAA